MPTTLPALIPTDNHLLALLQPDELARLRPRMARVTLALRDVLYNAAGPIDYVYFPRCGVLSLLTVLTDGMTCEVGITGREGFVHIVAALGAKSSPQRVICQVEAEVDRLPVEPFREELARNGGLRRLVDAYASYSYTQVAQTTACNRHHTVPARCARWLTMTHDRVSEDRFALTHEFLSTMLGVRRPSVTLALATLQMAGLISYTRGKVTILDRPGLEATACECYQIVVKAYDSLIGRAD